jgi:dTDP-4-amino-4,6-dideoxy-D-galactose acyltransferase
MNKTHYLKWDSNFWGLKTAQLNYSSHQENILQFLKQEGYELVYVFVKPEHQELNTDMIELGGKLVDQKITFETDTFNNIYIPDINIKEYKKNYVERDLLDLTLQAGIYSRFKIDNKIPLRKFEILYEEWIRKSVSKEIADNVYIYSDNDLKGMVTIKHYNDKSKIGLISVSKDSRGMNIGSKLISKVKSECFQRNIFKVDVVTQKDNIPACNFYIKNGFRETDKINIYHLWI